MRIGLRLLIGYFLVAAIAGYFILSIFLQEVKPGVRRATEGTLIDTANILAKIAAQDMHENNLQGGLFVRVFNEVDRYPLVAKIDGIIKNKIEYRVYITDVNGIVIFDSTGKHVGADYSRWNDVYLTLRGKYGARSTRDDPENKNSSVMYVAAPIYDNGQIIGSLTVAKPNRSMDVVIRRGERRIEVFGFLLLGIALLIGAIFVWWINRSINRLVDYANQVADGKKVALPQVNSPELTTLANALESMRVKLEGKAYVEHYVYTLTHELKSPLAAIRGATEILQDSPPANVAQRFLNNIAQQNQRIQHLVDRLLQQARLERHFTLQVEPIKLVELLNQLLESYATQALDKQINLQLNNTTPLTIQGDKLLLEQALNNLLENAFDFTPVGGHILLSYQINQGLCEITVTDSGEIIPDYALNKIFDRFYSLPRQDKDKSTGLGLSFVQEVAILHQGSITLNNLKQGGVQATFSLPIRRL